MGKCVLITHKRDPSVVVSLRRLIRLWLSALSYVQVFPFSTGVFGLYSLVCLSDINRFSCICHRTPTDGSPRLVWQPEKPLSGALTNQSELQKTAIAPQQRRETCHRLPSASEEEGELIREAETRKQPLWLPCQNTSQAKESYVQRHTGRQCCVLGFPNEDRVKGWTDPSMLCVGKS